MPINLKNFDYDKFISYPVIISDYTDVKFFVLDDLSRFYLIAIYLKVTPDKEVYLKRAFTSFGLLVSEVLDELDMNPLLTYNNPTTVGLNSNDKVLVRKKGDETQYFDIDNNLIYYSRKRVLPPVKKKYKDVSYHIPNQSFGILDLETYIGDDNISYVYAIGFYIEQENILRTFYINKEDFYSPNLVHNCFCELLKPKFMKKIFYVHNLGKFDSIFIIKNLTLYNERNKLKNPYYFEPVFRNNDFIKLVVKRVVEGKVRSVTLQDSYALLANSLYDLCNAYNVPIKKGIFPYSFVNKNTLFYIGVTPSINYYQGLNLNVYNTLVKQD